MMCAIESAKRGRNTLIIDHANKAGKKILMSGGGRCNFTNMTVNAEHFISHNQHFAKSALSRYTPWHFIKMVEDHSIPYHEKTLGQLFCDNKSKDIVNMLLTSMEDNGAQLKLDTSVTKITQLPSGQFSLKTTERDHICDSLVIATGGLSIPTMGASPFGYKVAEQFDIPTYATRAGLVPFTLHPHDKERYAELSGVSLPCTASCNGVSFKESLLFTHRGLSGPAILQISSYWNPGDVVSINCLPDLDFFDAFKKSQAEQPKTQINTWLSQWLPKNMIQTWFDHELLQVTLADISHKNMEFIQQSLQSWQLFPNNTEGYRTAEVTIGGVNCEYISSKTFEANTCKNLYFIGEVLDVSGWLGGYNFQWAWASGHCAGQYV